MTVASLVEAEGRGDAAAKISRVIYNRLKTTGPPTNGLLQIDATVSYALGRSLVAVPTSQDLQVDSPYNTYRNPGLPPGPIEAPGDAALEAAANPATGDWLFYVTVNLATGETKFTDSYDTFLEYKAELQRYCVERVGSLLRGLSVRAVLGDPIDHSLSPVRRGGPRGLRPRLDLRPGARRRLAGLAALLDGLDDTWRGLSRA